MEGSSTELRLCGDARAVRDAFAVQSASFTLRLLYVLACVGVTGCTGALESPQAPGRGNDAVTPRGEEGTRGPDGTLLPSPTASKFEAAPAALRKLTLLQYQNSVRDLLGSDLKLPEELEPDSSLNGFFSIGAAKATISPSGAEKIESAAYALAAQALDSAHRKALVPCTPSGVKDSACTRQVIARLGRQAFRRPVSAEESARYLALAEQAQVALNDFHAGLEFAVAGILQSPHFLFRVELAADSEQKGARPYDGYEIASRLSYLLWNSTPDAQLLAAAESGALSEPSGIREQSERLLADARAKAALSDFHSERLLLHGLNTLQKDTGVYRGFDDALRSSLRTDVLSTIEELTFGKDNDFRDLLTTRVAFVEPRLSQIYGLTGINSPMRVELPSSAGRVGLLGKAAFLAINAHESATSPTLRGKYVREQILCEGIGAPPPNVVTVLPEPNPNAPTMRERLKVHSENPGCAACHTRMDPIGLSLEHFDAIGRYRADDKGNALDTTGNLDGAEFDGQVELAQRLRADPRSSECVARQLYRYAVAHVETAGEAAAIEALVTAFQDSGYAFSELLRAVVVSDGFRFAGEIER